MVEGVKRRLTTILCADVSSYTRLMEHDEAGTLDRLRASRDSMAALIQRHDGRVVNTWGDALIAEFPSVVEAVTTAVEIQQELARRNHDLAEADRMWFRIGVNLGDIMVEKGRHLRRRRQYRRPAAAARRARRHHDLAAGLRSGQEQAVPRFRFRR